MAGVLDRVKALLARRLEELRTRQRRAALVARGENPDRSLTRQEMRAVRRRMAKHARYYGG